MNFKPKCLLDIAKKMKQGNVGILPFDTLYGLSCTLDKTSLENLAKLKGRDANKPFIIIVSSLEQAQALAYIDGTTLQPGPTTYICKKKPHIPDYITANLDTIAIRLPDYTPLMMLLHMIGEPIVSTSVNLSGEPAITSLSDIPSPMIDYLDFISSSYPPLYQEASTIIDITGPEPKCIRKGVSL